MRYIFVLILGLILSACQTNMSRQFEKLKPGDDKDTVLDLMGNPRHITRMNGEDRWYYLFYNDDTRQQKEVHFKDGLIVYSGDKRKPVPELDPVAIDSKNEIANVKYEAEIEKRKVDSKNAYNDFLKHERKIKKQDEIQYIPDFEPVE